MNSKHDVASCERCGQPTQHEEQRVGLWIPIGLIVSGAVLLYVGEYWSWVASLALLGAGIWSAFERQHRRPTERCIRCLGPLRAATSGPGGPAEILRRLFAILGVLLLIHAAAPGWETVDYFGTKRVYTFGLGFDLYELRVVEQSPFEAEDWQEIGRSTRFEPLGVSSLLLGLALTAFVGSKIAGRRARLANGMADAPGPESRGAAGTATPQ